MNKPLRILTLRRLFGGVVLLVAIAVSVQTAVGATSTQRTPEGESTSATAAPSTETLTALPPTSAPDPYADYKAPTGSILSSEAVKTLALQQAQRDGDANPTTITTAMGPLLSALEVMSPNSAPKTPLSAMTSGERATMEGDVYVIELDGSFTLADARVPPGEAAPQGTVLRLIVNARTGVLEGRSLSTSVQAPLGNLGKVKELG
jgi:hypothetical protein